MIDIWIHIALGPVILFISVLFWKFPPREINAMYGYRTRRSMSSNELWDYANQFCAKWMLVISLVTLLVQVASILVFSSEVAIIVSAVVLLVLILSLIPITEIRLKKLEENNGASEEWSKAKR